MADENLRDWSYVLKRFLSQLVNELAFLPIEVERKTLLGCVGVVISKRFDLLPFFQRLPRRTMFSGFFLLTNVLTMDELQIGPYMVRATELEAFQYADKYNMYATYSKSKGQGDSLGGNADMYFVYRDERFVHSAMNMWYWNEQGKYIGQRHPEVDPDDHPMSRDHYHSTLSVLKMHYDDTGSQASMDKIKEITDNTGYIISKMARRGLGLKWWSKAIQGDRFRQALWHINGIVQAILLYLPVHFILGAIAKFDEEVEQEDWKPWPESERLQDLPKWKQVIEDIMYPSYAMQMVGWKLYVTDNHWLKKLHQKAYRPMVGKTNYVQMMLLGMDVPRERIESYKAMRGGRWGGYLSNRNDRNMRVLDPPFKYNNLDRDVARKLFNETQL